ENFSRGHPSKHYSKSSTFNYRVFFRMSSRKGRCTLLVWIAPIKSFKLFLIVQSHTCTISKLLNRAAPSLHSFRIPLFRMWNQFIHVLLHLEACQKSLLIHAAPVITSYPFW